MLSLLLSRIIISAGATITAELSDTPCGSESGHTGIKERNPLFTLEGLRLRMWNTRFQTILDPQWFAGSILYLYLLRLIPPPPTYALTHPHTWPMSAMAKKLTLESGPVSGGVTKLATVLQPCSCGQAMLPVQNQHMAANHVTGPYTSCSKTGFGSETCTSCDVGPNSFKAGLELHTKVPWARAEYEMAPDLIYESRLWTCAVMLRLSVRPIQLRFQVPEP